MAARRMARPFVGWDFSYLRERRETVDNKTWQLDDLLIDAADEVARVLRGGGRLVTQQDGDRTNLDLHQLLGAPAPDRAPWNADVARVAAEAAGLRVLRAEDAYPITRFHDVGAIAYYLKAVA